MKYEDIRINFKKRFTLNLRTSFVEKSTEEGLII